MSRSPRVTIRVTLCALTVATWPVALEAQGLSALLQQAAAAEGAKRYTEAARLYEKAYGVSGFDPTGLVLAATSAIAGRDSAAAVRLLERAFGEGFFQPGFLAYAERDSGFALVRRQRRWPKILADARRRYAAVDTTLRGELLRLAEQDQRNRSGLDTIVTRYGRQSRQADSVFRALTQADEPLQTRLAAIVRERGWPGRRLVGDDGAHAAWLVLQHMPPRYQQAALRRLRTAAARHDVRPGDLALLEDRVLADQGRPQLYGSQTRWAPNGGPSTLAPIANEACVDRRRARMGLEPLAEYLKTLGVPYAPAGAQCKRGE